MTSVRLGWHFLQEAARCARFALTVRREPLGYIWLDRSGEPCRKCGRVHAYYSIGCDGHSDPPIALLPPSIGLYPPTPSAGVIPFWKEPPNGAWVVMP